MTLSQTSLTSTWTTPNVLPQPLAQPFYYVVQIFFKKINVYYISNVHLDDAVAAPTLITAVVAEILDPTEVERSLDLAAWGSE